MDGSAGPRGLLRLDVHTGDALFSYPLPASGKVTIGRAEGNDVRVDHRSVSRNHAVLHLGPTIRVEDLGGPNGTSVRNPREPASDDTTESLRRITGKAVDVAVGDCITLGSVMVVVRRVLPELAGAAEQAVIIRDRAMQDLYEQASLAARAPISVLLLGETGVGKEVLAQAIHRSSPRAAKPFLGLHCAALAESLLESELFGHERGAFTGAVGSRPGLFESANGGTVFLDEIGELPMAIQIKLLRLLETREVLRVGGRSPIRIDVRFVSATHRDLEAAVASGSFRADLYFRLNGITLTIPPLRERVAEIAPLALRFIEIACREIDRPRGPSISSEAQSLLERYPWPGNVRELRNVIARAVVLCPGDTLRPEHLPPKLASAAREEAPRGEAASGAGDVIERLRDEVAARERRRIVEALEKCHGNQTQAAELLGISRRTLVTRLGEHGLPRPRKKS